MTTRQQPGTRFFSPRVPGTPGHILAVLDRPDSAPSLLILRGHGDEDGFVIEPVAEGIGVDLSMLVRPDRLPPHALAGTVRLGGWTVVSTGRMTGSPAMVDAFRNGGVAVYIAPDEYPDAPDAVLFAMHLFHALIVRTASVEDAWRRTAAYCGGGRMIMLHTPAQSFRLGDDGDEARTRDAPYSGLRTKDQLPVIPRERSDEGSPGFSAAR